MTTTTTRRAILAGAAALPALSLPAIATPAQGDPIFEAIEKHRKLNAAHVAACEATVPFSEASGGKRTPAIEAMEDHAGHCCEIAASALSELLALTPATIAGCAALLRHIENITGKESFDQGGLFQDFCDEIEEPAKTLLSRVAVTLDRAVQS
jgi:hypothetical protein